MARPPRARRPKGQVFLGGIAAEGTKAPAPLSAGFAELHAKWGDAIDAYNQRRYTTVELATVLARLRIEDTAGGEWTIGATTGNWYRRMPGLGWANVEPPGKGVVAKSRQAHVDELGRASLPPSGKEAWETLLDVSSWRDDVSIAPLWATETASEADIPEPASIEWAPVTNPVSAAEMEELLGSATDRIDEPSDWQAGTVTWTSPGGLPAETSKEWLRDTETSDILEKGTVGAFDAVLDED